MSKNKNVNEGASWWLMRKPAPYKIEPAGGYTADMTPELHHDFLLNRQKEADNNFIKAVGVARIDEIEPYMVAVYDSVAAAREFLQMQVEFPGLSGATKNKINKLVKSLDKVNMYVSTNILDKLDELNMETEKEELEKEARRQKTPQVVVSVEPNQF